jgi:hypothetical protein
MNNQKRLKQTLLASDEDGSLVIERSLTLNDSHPSLNKIGAEAESESANDDEKARLRKRIITCWVPVLVGDFACTIGPQTLRYAFIKQLREGLPVVNENESGPSQSNTK